MDSISLPVLLPNSYQTNLYLSDSYLYWSSPALTCFHIAYISGISHSPQSLTITIFDSDLFKPFTFSPQEPASLFIQSLSSVSFPSPLHFSIIYNPNSGSNSSLKILDTLLIPLLSNTPHSYEINQVSEFTLSTNLIILGGDGTVHSVINSLPNISDHNIAVIPTGTRNSFSIALSGKSLNKSIFHIIKNKKIKCDLVKVKLDTQVVYCTSAVLWGIPADVPKIADELRGLGKARFAVAVLTKLLEKWSYYYAKVSIKSNNLTFKVSEFTGIFIGNNKSENFTNDEVPFPKAVVNDGQIDVLLVETCTKLWAFSIFWQMMNGGKHLNNLRVEAYKAKKVEIEGNRKREFSIDGETYQSKKAKIKVLNNGLNCFGSLYN